MNELNYRFGLFSLCVVVLTFCLVGVLYGFLAALGVLAIIATGCVAYRFLTESPPQETFVWQSFGDHLYRMEVG